MARKGVKVVVVSAVIVLVLIVGGLIAWQTGLINFNKCVYIPRANVEELAAESIEYIEYEGRIYRHDGRIYRQCYDGGPEGSECLGKVNDGISGITGNVKGDVYPVEGMDPEYMLAVDKEDDYCLSINDYALLYINDNDITLRTGEDWFGDRLNAKGNIEWVSCGRLDVCYEAPPMLDASELPKADEFMEALYESPFVYCDGINIDEGIPYFVDIGLTNGITFQLQLVESGYVLLKNNYLIWEDYPVCIKMDHPIFDEMLDLCWPARKEGK